MFVGVFEKDREKMIKNGCKLICTQGSEKGKIYIFKNTNKVNFSKENIDCFEINKICL